MKSTSPSSVISSDAFARLVASGKRVDLLDVRTPAEYREVHLPLARNIPLDKLDAAALLRERRADGQPLYVLCRSGGRGQSACEKLARAGLANVINVEGGTTACIAAGMEVVRGAATMSLERQVRIAAGSLVLLGMLLGIAVHRAFFGLSAFVGAGLVFAGITDFCGMALLLARMPWNGTRMKKSIKGDAS